MKVIVSGSRYIEDYKLVCQAIAESGFKPTMIIEGGQRRKNPVTGEIVGGIDYLAQQWAIAHGVPCITINAKWKQYGKAAGPIRNAEMADIGDVLVAVPEGRSIGTRGIIDIMTFLGKPVFVKEA